jgi:hypothetical protein
MEDLGISHIADRKAPGRNRQGVGRRTSIHAPR